jgi:RND family efflux transporter MFP subunit
MRQLFEGEGDESLEGVISRELYDEKRYTFEEAQMAHETAKVQAVRSTVDLEFARQGEQQAELDYRTAVFEQGLRQLKSPIDGHVTFLDKKPGELISTSETVFSVVNANKLEAKLFVPQSNLPDLEVGQRVIIECEVFKGRDFDGRLEVISPVVDRENGMVRAWVGITNREALEFLRPGMFVSGEILLKTREDALMVSKKAILFENQQSVIYLVEGDRARRYAVKSDPDFEDLTHIEVRGLLGVNGEYVEPLPTHPAVVFMGQRNLKEVSLIELEKPVEKNE